jgi:hypothetical protein
MLRYFVAGNVWLCFALLAFVGRTPERFVRSRPGYSDGYTVYSVLGLGTEFGIWEYRGLVGGLLCMAVVCFILAARKPTPGSSPNV